MEILIFAIILFLSFLIGTFGFCQIVGIIKYLKISKCIGTLLLWAVILGLGALVVIKWFNYYSPALYIGYGVSLIMSFRVKPDEPIKKEDNTYKNVFPNDNETDENILPRMTNEDKKELDYLNTCISKLQETYNNAVRDLGNLSIDDIEFAYKYNRIDETEYENIKRSFENLSFMKDTLPNMITKMKEKRDLITSKYL